MKYILTIMAISICSCTKPIIKTPPIENKPVLIQIEAVYIDGNTDLSPVVLVR